MKKILLYALSYLGITATVGITVSVVAPALTDTSNSLPNNSQVENTPTDDNEEEEKEEEEILPPTEMELFMNNLMSIQYADIEDLSISIQDQKQNEYLINLYDSYLTVDINTLEFGFEGNLSVQALGINLDANISFVNNYIYLEVKDETKTDVDYLLRGKLHANDLIEGITELLPKFGVEMPSLDMGGFDVNSLLGSLTSITFASCEESSYKKGTMNLLDLANIDFYVDIQGTDFDKTVELKQLAIKDLELEGMLINVFANAEIKSEPLTLTSPETEEKVYADYSRLFDVVDNAFALAQQTKFDLSLEALVTKNDEEFLTLDLDAAFDIENIDVYADADISFLGNDLSLMARYDTNGDAYFDINEGLLKGRLPNATIADILDLVKSKVGNDSTASITEAFGDIAENPFIQEILAGNYEGIQQLLDQVELTDTAINIRFNPSVFGLVGESGLISIDVTDNSLNGLYIGGLAYYNEADETTYGITLSVKVNEFTELPTVNPEEYPDYTVLYNIFEEIMALTTETQFALDVNASIANIIDGVETDTTMSIKGRVQADLTDMNNEENPTKTYGLKLFAQLEMVVTEFSSKTHLVTLQVVEDVVYLSYTTRGSSSTLSLKIDICTIMEIVNIVMDLMNVTEEDEDANQFISNTINNLMNSSGDLINLDNLSVNTLKEFTVDDVNNSLFVSVDGSFVNMNTDFNIGISHNESGKLALSVSDFVNGKDIVDIGLALADHDDSLYAINESITYYDFNSLKFLLQFGINNIQQTYYHIVGSATIDVLGIINKTIDIDAKIWQEDGKLSALITLSNIPYFSAIGYGLLTDKYVSAQGTNYGQADVENATAYIFLHDGMAYVERTHNITFKKKILGMAIGSSSIETYTRRVITDMDTFMTNIGDILLETVLDFSDGIKDLMTGGESTNANEMSIEKFLTNYYCQDLESGDKKFVLGVNIDALLCDGSFGDSIVEITSSGDHLNSIYLETSIYSVIDLNANLSLTDYGTTLSQEEINGILDYVNNIHTLNHTSGFNTHYGESSSHARA